MSYQNDWIFGIGAIFGILLTLVVQWVYADIHEDDDMSDDVAKHENNG